MGIQKNVIASKSIVGLPTRSHMCEVILAGHAKLISTCTHTKTGRLKYKFYLKYKNRFTFVGHVNFFNETAIVAFLNAA